MAKKINVAWYGVFLFLIGISGLFQRLIEYLGIDIFRLDPFIGGLMFWFPILLIFIGIVLVIIGLAVKR